MIARMNLADKSKDDLGLTRLKQLAWNANSRWWTYVLLETLARSCLSDMVSYILFYGRWNENFVFLAWNGTYDEF